MDSPQESNTVQIQLYNSSLQNEWNNYINKSPHSVFAHHLGWKDVVKETYGHEPFYFMAYRNDRVVGVLPLFFIKSLLFKQFMVTSPYLTFGGIISDDENVTTALIHKAIETGRQQHIDYIEIRNELKTNCLSHNKSVYYTLLLDLSPGIDALWNSHLHRSARRNIQIANRSGLVVEEGHHHLKNFVDINARNMRRLGTPAHNHLFFSNILKYFPDTTLIMARSGNTYIGGMLIVYFKDTALEWIASLKSYFHLKPNDFLYWEAIKRVAKKGCQYFDFGRSKWESGTFNFKLRYGAKPIQLYYQYYLNRLQKMPHVDPDNSSFKTLISIWKKLPLSVTKRIGHRIIRNIP